MLFLIDKKLDFLPWLKNLSNQETNYLLWVNGRSGNTQNLGLEQVRIEINHRGQIDVTESYQPHIYAVGDVVGAPGSANASYDKGRFISAYIADGDCDWPLMNDFPTGIYTSPEISSIGRTERQLTADKVPYKEVPLLTIYRSAVWALKLKAQHKAQYQAFINH